MRSASAGIGDVGMAQAPPHPSPRTASAVAWMALPLIAWLLGPRDRSTLALLVVAPLLEEAVFRAGLQEALLVMGRSPLGANVLTSLAFGLTHVAVRGQASALLVIAPAFLIGLLYARWGRLRICVAVHSLMNGGWLAWSYLGPAPNFGT